MTPDWIAALATALVAYLTLVGIMVSGQRRLQKQIEEMDRRHREDYQRLWKEIREQSQQAQSKMETQGGQLRGQIETQGGQLRGQIETQGTELRNEIRELAVQQVDQNERLARIEGYLGVIGRVPVAKRTREPAFAIEQRTPDSDDGEVEDEPE